MNIIDIYEESPNGYIITGDAPTDSDMAIQYYLDAMTAFADDELPREFYPLEYFFVHYELAMVLMLDKSKPLMSDARSKRVENALYHLSRAFEYFTHRNYPMMYAVMCMYMGRLFRERALLIFNRSILSKRSTPEDSVQHGIDQILEAFPILYTSVSHTIEQAICSLETGWLYVVQSEFLIHAKDENIKENAYTYLERAISLYHQVISKTAAVGTKPRTWNLDDKKTYPKHIAALLDGFTLNYIEGSALYLLGRLHEAWNFSFEKQEKAFEYYCKCVKTKYLTKDSPLWADAHHRAANIIIKYPLMVDSEFTPGSRSTLHLESAISHLTLALRCKNLTSAAQSDIYFHLSQAHISKLQVFIDKIPANHSVTRTIAASTDALETLRHIEYNLREGLNRVTGANAQSTQDAFIFFYSCLKIAEYRMLEGACRLDLSADKRLNYLIDAVEYMIDALISRSLVDNMDMHYIATSQMSQILLSVKHSYAATKSYAKTMICLSAMLMRALYNPEVAQQRIGDQTNKELSLGLIACSKDIIWIKKHYGPIKLHESLSPGLALWSFEDMPTAAKVFEEKQSNGTIKNSNSNGSLLSLPALKEEDKEDENNEDVDDDNIKGSSVASDHGSKAGVRSPPKGVPPLLLPNAPMKKIYPSGEVAAKNLAVPVIITGAETREKASFKPKPPQGSIPLHALGHTPDPVPEIPNAAVTEATKSFNLFNAVGIFGKTVKQSTFDKRQHLYLEGPYGRRMRRRVPPTKLMESIDAKNQQSFGGGAVGKTPYTIPHQKKRTEKSFNIVSQKKDMTDAPTYGDPNNKSRKKATDDDNHSDIGSGSGSDNNNENKDNSASRSGSDDQYSYSSYSSSESSYSSKSEDGVDDDDNEVNNNDSESYSQRKKREAKDAMPKATALSKQRISDMKGKEHRKSGNNSFIRWLLLGNTMSEQEKAKNATYAGDTNVKQKKPLAYFRFPKLALSLKNKSIDPSLVQNKPKKPTAKTKLSKEFGLWASGQAFYYFMSLSRASRMMLVLRCYHLEVVDGERFLSILYSLKPKHAIKYLTFRRELIDLCAELIFPPSTLRELSEKSYVELQVLFKGHSSISRKLEELELFIYEKIYKYDYFIPMVASIPLFSRNLESFDDTLLNPAKLIPQIRYEESYHILQERDKMKNANKEHVSMLSSANSTMSENNSAQAVTVQTGKSVHHLTLTSDQILQRKETKDELALGKMTLSLSQILDGSGHMTNNDNPKAEAKTKLKEADEASKFERTGAREMLIKYLGSDECMIIWHLPAIGAHNLQVVLVWRDNSVSNHEYYSFQESVAASIAAEKAKKKKKFKQPIEPFYPPGHKGLIMEVARSDLDMYHVQHLIRNLITAFHSRPAPLRLTLSSDALRSLSCALSITELLTMVPPHVTSLVMCCPPFMRMIPFHLLLIEVPNDSPASHDSSVNVDGGLNVKTSASSPATLVKEIHLMEQYNVRLGPTLSIFELCAVGTSQLSQAVGLHRMVAVDGEAEGLRSPGARGTDLEVACVTSLWSNDPEEYKIMMNQYAAPRFMQTGLFTSVFNRSEEAKFIRFKDSMEVEKRDRFNPMQIKTKSENNDNQNEVKESAETKMTKDVSSKPAVKRPDTAGGSRGDGNAKQVKVKFLDEVENAEEEFKPVVKKTPEEEEEERILFANKHALTLCRVLHISAQKVALSVPAANANLSDNKNDQKIVKQPEPTKKSASVEGTVNTSNSSSNSSALSEFEGGVSGIEAAIALPPYDRNYRRHREVVRGQSRNASSVQLSSRQVTKQLYVRNCALCVLSRFGITDHVTEPMPKAAEANTEFIESMHLAGANTIMYPAWSGGAAAGGLSSLATSLFLLRFYTILPSYSRHPRPVVEATNRAQLWLRNCTADDAIAFLAKAFIPEKARDALIEEMESFVVASNGPTAGGVERMASNISNLSKSSMIYSVNSQSTPQTGTQDAENNNNNEKKPEGTKGNRIGGDRKYFTHFLHWGAFIVSGTGQGVHHPDITEEKELNPDAAAKALKNDKELDNIAFEVEILRMEGKIAEALELEARIRQLRADRIKKRLGMAADAGIRAGRGIMDGLGFLDKMLFVQDSDSIEVSGSDDSDDSLFGKKKITKLKSEKKPKEKKEDETPVGNERRLSIESAIEVDEDENDNENDPMLPAGSKKRMKLKFKPQPLDLTIKKADPSAIGFDKWKAKVGNLNMNANQTTSKVLPSTNDEMDLIRKQKILMAKTMIPIDQDGKPSTVAGNASRDHDYSLKRSMKNVIGSSDTRDSEAKNNDKKKSLLSSNSDDDSEGDDEEEEED
eukprot:gene7843-10650_t